MHIAWPNLRRRLVFKQLRRRRTMIVLAVIVLFGLGHAIILRLLARPLLAEGSTQPAGFYCLQGNELGADGFEPFEQAAAWQAKASGRKILLLLPPDSRVVEIGAVPSFERMCRRELGKRRIPPSEVGTIHATTSGVWGEAHAMRDWLLEHPGATVVLACDPMGSGRLRYVFDKVIGPADAARVRLTWLPRPRSGPDTWWRSRGGVKDFMFAWLELIYAWAEGDVASPPPADHGYMVPAAAFQQEIRAKIGEAPP